MIEAPQTCWTHAEHRLAMAVAASPAFGELLGPGISDPASRVFGDQGDLPLDGRVYTLAELEALAAFAHVYSAPGAAYTIARNDAAGWDATGTAIVVVDRLLPDSELAASDGRPATERWFKNRVGRLMEDLWDHTWDNGLVLTSLAVTAGPGMTEESRWRSQARWQHAEITIAWGEQQ